MSIFEKKTWTDRITEYPKRRRLNEVEGQPNIFDVDREEGIITSEGDAFNSTNMNSLENRIEVAFDNTETKINTVRAGVQLFSSNGTSGTITLNDNVSNYDYLEIYYKENQDEAYYCIKVTPTFKSTWRIHDIRYDGGGYIVFNTRKLNITNTTITQSGGRYANFQNGGSPVIRDETHLYILKVKGYKNNI